MLSSNSVESLLSLIDEYQDVLFRKNVPNRLAFNQTIVINIELEMIFFQMTKQDPLVKRNKKLICLKCEHVSNTSYFNNI